VEHDRSTDTWSASLEDKTEKLAFLREYLAILSEVIDAEYHIVYHDNSGGMIPGPSDWDIRAVLKVAPEDVPLWTDGVNMLISYQLDPSMWDDLKTAYFTWTEPEGIECWKLPDSKIYMVTYIDSGIILLRASTVWIPEYNKEKDEKGMPGFNVYKPLVAEKLGYDKSISPYISAIQVEKGLLTAGSQATVILFEVYVNESMLANILVLVIDIEGYVVITVLVEESYFSSFFLADIDGDGYAEILTRHDTGGNGGAGTHTTEIFKLSESELVKIFANPCWEEYDCYALDTGFKLTLSNGWNYTVDNIFTGFSISFSREIPEENPYFDEKGRVSSYAKEFNREGTLYADPYFFIFEPVDVDNDGIFEIMTAQYTFLYGRSDDLGDAYTILSWNAASNEMEIIQAGYWSYPNDIDDWDSFREQRQEYRDNWYRR